MALDPAAQPESEQQDAALREEVRQLVVARNERRAERGEPPLDVEAEMDRQLRDLVLICSGCGRFGYITGLWPDSHPLEEIVTRPGVYFNPQTEVMIVVDDSAELDGEIFNMEEFEGSDWVLISDEDADRRAPPRRAAAGLPDPLPPRRRAQHQR